MKKLIARFGLLNVITFIIMAIGVLLWGLTPLLLWLLDFDSDIIGLLIFLIGLVLFGVGFVVKLFKGKPRT
jgi:hypothetical protein